MLSCVFLFFSLHVHGRVFLWFDRGGQSKNQEVRRWALCETRYSKTAPSYLLWMKCHIALHVNTVIARTLKWNTIFIRCINLNIWCALNYRIFCVWKMCCSICYLSCVPCYFEYFFTNLSVTSFVVIFKKMEENMTNI